MQNMRYQNNSSMIDVRFQRHNKFVSRNISSKAV